MTKPEQRIPALVAWAALLFAPALFSAEPLFVATPLTQGEFSAGIEGPACDRDGNVLSEAKKMRLVQFSVDRPGLEWSRGQR